MALPPRDYALAGQLLAHAVDRARPATRWPDETTDAGVALLAREFNARPATPDELAELDAWDHIRQWNDAAYHDQDEQ